MLIKLAFHLGERLSGLDIFTYHLFLMKSQWWDNDKIRYYQNKKLKILIMYAFCNVPYYRKVFDYCGITPENIKSVDDLIKLPVLTREDIIENYEDLKPKSYKGKTRLLKTGGTSTGRPLSITMGKESFARTYASFFRCWCNYNMGERVVRYMDPIRFKHDTIFSLFRDTLLRHKWIIIRENEEKTDVLEKKLLQIAKYNPKYIKGRPSSLSRLAELCEKENFRRIRPNSIFSNGETLFLSQRDKLESIFKSEVFDLYGGEGGIAAFECEKHNGYHLSSETGIVEIVSINDKNKLVKNKSEIGCVIGTDLNNYAMPMIRYEIGDLARYDPKSNFCDCGRGLPLIKCVEGRYSSVINNNGRVITEKTFEGFIRSIDFFKKINIPAYIQLVLIEGNILDIRVKKELCCTETILRNLKDIFISKLGKNYRVNISTVNNLIRTESDKQAFVINDVSTSNYKE